MKRMITYSEAKSILALDSISPYDNNRDIWKSQAITYGAVLNYPYSESSWALNRLLPVDVAMKQMYKITFDPNNGGQDAPYTIRVAAGVTPNPTDPTYSGHNFAGWSPTLAPASADTTYTAQWAQSSYTIVFKNDDEQTVVATKTPTASQIITKPIPDPTSTKQDPGMIYEFTGWVLDDANRNKYLGNQIKKASDLGPVGTYVFIAEYNGKDLPDNHVKILDNIGQYPSNDPTTRNTVTPDGYIGGYNPADTSKGWYSGPMDGHSDDIKGKDAGISPIGSATGRSQLTLNNIVYTAYDGDSIVYEFLTISSNNTYENGNVARFANNSYKTISDIEASDLISEWTGYDNDGNAIINIKSNNSWIKFAIIAKTDTNTGQPPLLQPIGFIDPQETEPSIIVQDVPISVEIVYYIADNNQTSNTASRKGTVSVLVYGEQYNKTDCIYVSSQYTQTPWSDRSYMTKGTVYFYQLGTNLGS